MARINTIRIRTRDGLVATAQAGEYLSNADAPVQIIVEDAQFEDGVASFETALIYTMTANGMPAQPNLVFDHSMPASNGTLSVFFENRRA